MHFPMIHVCYRVLDLEASEKFYMEAFGFEISRKKDFPGDFTLSYLRAPGLDFEIELTYNYGHEEPYTIGDGYSHLAVSAEDLEASHKRHREMGLEMTDLKGLAGGKPRFYFVTDPDGYRVEVVRKAE